MTFEWLLLVHFVSGAAIAGVCYHIGLRTRRNRNGLRLGRRDRPRFRRAWPTGR